MKSVADCILRLFENEKELFVKRVPVQNTIGFNQNGSGNVLKAVFGQPYEVGRLWNQQNCHSTNGICAWHL